jgi:hypothetical protein
LVNDHVDVRLGAETILSVPKLGLRLEFSTFNSDNRIQDFQFKSRYIRWYHSQ